ncbi:MarR family winged helix-turn-helix transcriptional regulator [Variovorax sp. VNK109]|uniref:MarR family winged helix-turn-helix transcriptional regulator n=1 Tax=Variovorax sp. VNK109 TaxID=3400919 RepID=UPI003C0ECF72
MSTLKKNSGKGVEACPWRDLGPQGGGLELEDYPTALLMRVANHLQAEITGVNAKLHELSVPEYRILSRLYVSAPMQLSALCRTSFFDKAYAGRILRALEARGLALTSVDEAHKRRQIVDITPAGRELARRIAPLARRSQARLLEVLSTDERVALYGALKKLLNANTPAAPAAPVAAPKETRK